MMRVLLCFLQHKFVICCIVSCSGDEVREGGFNVSIWNWVLELVVLISVDGALWVLGVFFFTLGGVS